MVAGQWVGVMLRHLMSAASVLQELGLTPKSIAALQRKAKGHGKSTPEYVKSLIQADLLADQSFDEILAPVRAGFRQSGLSVKELDAMLARARKKAPAQKRRSPAR